MAGMLEKLSGDEAVLLMYLADELPREDRAEVALRLKAEPALRQELDRLAELNSTIAGRLEALDDVSPVPVSDDAAARLVVRTMLRHQFDLAQRPADPAKNARPTALAPLWYGIGAVAAAVVIFFGLWGAGVIDVPVNTHLPAVVTGPSLIDDPTIEVATDDTQANTPGPSNRPNPANTALVVDVGELTRSFEAEPTRLDEARMHLAELEALADFVVD